MKRSAPLRRRAFLARKTPLARTGPLRRVSAKKAAWNRLYGKALKAALAAQIQETGSTYCVKCGAIGMVEPHHPFGRIGANILRFRLICAQEHHEIHFVSPKKARAEGWLAPRGNVTAGGEA